MRLLDTIQNIIKEAENDLYDASFKSCEYEEIEKLQKKLDDSIKLLELYKNLY